MSGYRTGNFLVSPVQVIVGIGGGTPSIYSYQPSGCIICVGIDAVAGDVAGGVISVVVVRPADIDALDPAVGNTAVLD